MPLKPTADLVLISFVSGFIRGITLRFFEGFSWHANLTSASNPSLSMTRASWAFGSETSSISVTTFTLQVVHLPFPPHTET